VSDRQKAAMNVEPTGTNPTVTGAIRQAARMTGADFKYLLATAQVESNLNPNAQAATSSARGLFQFTEQTWLTTLKEQGGPLGYGPYANAISRQPSGDYAVSDPSMTRAVMNLRSDPNANALMAGAFTKLNADKLADRLGRGPTERAHRWHLFRWRHWLFGWNRARTEASCRHRKSRRRRPYSFKIDWYASGLGCLEPLFDGVGRRLVAADLPESGVDVGGGLFARKSQPAGHQGIDRRVSRAALQSHESPWANVRRRGTLARSLAGALERISGLGTVGRLTCAAHMSEDLGMGRMLQPAVRHTAGQLALPVGAFATLC